MFSRQKPSIVVGLSTVTCQAAARLYLGLFHSKPHPLGGWQLKMYTPPSKNIVRLPPPTGSGFPPLAHHTQRKLTKCYLSPPRKKNYTCGCGFILEQPLAAQRSCYYYRFFGCTCFHPLQKLKGLCFSVKRKPPLP